MAVSDDGRGDAEARLLAVIRRIVQAMPHATAERGRGADASAAATEALRVMFELRLHTAEGSPIRRRYDEMIVLLREWRDL